VKTTPRFLMSVVVPCYNEENRLEPTLSETLRYMETTFSKPFEIVFADDGSTDATASILEKARASFSSIPIEIVRLARNEGKGGAVKAGVLQARGEKIIVMDADFSIDVRETPKFLDALDSYDVVIGTKKHLLTRTLNKQKRPRRFLGKGFTILTNFALGLTFTDITCGFKGFRAEAAKDLFGRQTLKRWSYDSEILFLGKTRKYRMAELPVTWYHVEGSKVHVVKDTLRSFRELVRIRFNQATGRYK